MVDSDEDQGRSRRLNANDWRMIRHKSCTRWLDDREVGWKKIL
jgi:hypothetical protein